MMGIDFGQSEPILVSEDLVEARERKVAGIVEVDFDGLLQPPLKLLEDAKEGCGGHLWPAGLVLAKYLLRQPQLSLLRGRTMFVR